MKKIDFSKDIISVEDDGSSVRFLYRLKNSRSDRPNMVIFTDVDGSESWDFFDDYGSQNGVQKIKNAPETITFWVPVWESDCDGPVVGWNFIEKRGIKPAGPPGGTERKTFIGWKGPFTFEVD